MKKTLTTLILIAGTMLFGATAGGPKTFGSPEEARDALLQAAASGLDAVNELFGSGSAEIVRTGDAVQDKLHWKFNKRQPKRHSCLGSYKCQPCDLLLGEDAGLFSPAQEQRWFLT
jgi:hypothetical protein